MPLILGTRCLAPIHCPRSDALRNAFIEQLPCDDCGHLVLEEEQPDSGVRLLLLHLGTPSRVLVPLRPTVLESIR